MGGLHTSSLYCVAVITVATKTINHPVLRALIDISELFLSLFTIEVISIERQTLCIKIYSHCR